jgi:D-alanyl-D-alanine dipeptidase
MNENNRNIVLMNDIRIRQVKLLDNGEVFVDILQKPNHLHVDESRSQIGNHTIYYASVRRAVSEKLIAAQASLAKNVNLLIKECFRPLSLQKLFYERWLSKVASNHPDWTPDQLRQEASVWVAPIEVAPHSTGGAVDLTLMDGNGHELDMGTTFNANPIETRDAIYFMASGISSLARKNRSILKEAMESVGFVNYPTEWWHWSYGDRYWAFATKQQEAFYGSVEKPKYV